MDNPLELPGLLCAVPASTATPMVEYSRARCLLNIIASAAMQLRQDADKLEQEDMALASRLQSIEGELQKINANDPLLERFSHACSLQRARVVLVKVYDGGRVLVKVEQATETYLSCRILTISEAAAIHTGYGAAQLVHLDRRSAPLAELTKEERNNAGPAGSSGSDRG